MNAYYRLHPAIRLHIPNRISARDADRQMTTAAVAIERFNDQPGLILADEVGMGKTFVALAIALSVHLDDKRRRPIVVMIPPNLREKWPQDFATFVSNCIPNISADLQCATAESSLEFIRLTSEPSPRKKAVIFMTHGAMNRGTADDWVKVALIYRALKGRHHADAFRQSVCENMAAFAKPKGAPRKDPGFWEQLFKSQPSDWLEVTRARFTRDHSEDKQFPLSHDLVPSAFLDALEDIDTNDIYAALTHMPLRDSDRYEERVKAVNAAVDSMVKAVWRDQLSKLKLNLPLLVFDEAHHLKNENQTAKLFRTAESESDADEVAKGKLAQVFERMLFLTATPFQLGHHELCNVLHRFRSIKWDGARKPAITESEYEEKLKELARFLDATREHALLFEKSWGSLRNEDLRVGEVRFDNTPAWWKAVEASPDAATDRARRIREHVQRTKEAVAKAEKALYPWVIRHLKDREINGRPRRKSLPGDAINTGEPGRGVKGLDVEGDALLPFLIAARAVATSPQSRPVFAEGLSSCYQTFLETRVNNAKAKLPELDGDDPTATANDREADPLLDWYLQKIKSSIPVDEHGSALMHPKLGATMQKALELWRSGQKTLVFCFYKETGKALQRAITRAIQGEVVRLAQERSGLATPEEAIDLVRRLSERFNKADAPVRLELEDQTRNLLKAYPELAAYQDSLVNVVRRMVRTPSFLVRYFPKLDEEFPREAIRDAMTANKGAMPLVKLLDDFFTFLVKKCDANEDPSRDTRKKYIDALESFQTGSTLGSIVAGEDYDPLAETGRAELIPNVRLANGDTGGDTRKTLMYTFNTPFFPEVLVASSIMAEGVDLHLYCRHVIHHDLCWNPSTLEQRTGRLDRIGGMVERGDQPIEVYLPYIAETQDERVFKVVMDRERWFKVVMGEEFKTDAASTEALAERLPLPEALVGDLIFDLSVWKGASAKDKRAG